MSQYQRDGKWRYHARIQLPSGRRRRVKGTPVTNTKAAAKAAESAHVFRLMHPEAVARVDLKKEVPLLRDFADLFLKGYAADHAPTEQEGKLRTLNANILPALGGMRLDEINQGTVDLFRADLLAGGRSTKTVNNIISVLSSLMKYASELGHIPEPKLRFITRTVGGDEDVIPVAPEDVEKLLACAKDRRYRVGILLSAEAGLRIGEVRGLFWVNIDMIGRMLTVCQQIDSKNRVRPPKHGKTRVVPMSSRLHSELSQLPQTGDTVITKLKSPTPPTYWALRDGLDDTYKLAGVVKPPDLWHCLRHTYGTRLANSGTPIQQIQKLMGHRSIKTTLRYLHTNRSELAAAVARTFG